jgi:secondary thiamine-phosphate synthase enzyme
MHTLTIQTSGRGTTDITDQVQTLVHRAGATDGACLVFLQHTSASLLITENADPTVRRDLEAWLQKHIPDGDPLFRHTAEGPDDMPAHVRAALLPPSIAVPIVGGRLALGTWQGLYLYEHRARGHQRRVQVTLLAAARG